MQTENPSAQVFFNVMLIVVGVMIACYGEIQFVLIGFFFQAMGVLTEASRLVMVQRLLNSEGLNMDPLCSLYYFAPVCAVFNLVGFYTVEYSNVTTESYANVGATHFLANACCALGLNIAVVFLVLFINLDWQNFFAGTDSIRCPQGYPSRRCVDCAF